MTPRFLHFSQQFELTAPYTPESIQDNVSAKKVKHKKERIIISPLFQESLDFDHVSELGCLVVSDRLISTSVHGDFWA